MSRHLGNDSQRASGMSALPLLPGEEQTMLVRNVHYLDHCSGTMKPGDLVLSNYRLFFRTTLPGGSEAGGGEQLLVDEPLAAISQIEKMGSGATVQRSADAQSRVRIWCKDLRLMQLSFGAGVSVSATHVRSTIDAAPRKQFLEALRRAAFPPSREGLFAFAFRQAAPNFGTDGWKVYNAMAEFKRLGVHSSVDSGSSWRISHANINFELADTYPRLLAVPADASDDFLHAVASFRSRGRIPILSWIHPETQASITRSSQPQVGLNGRRSKEDEKYVGLLMEANAQCSKLCIMDARPLINATAQKARGGGYESEENYPESEVNFLDIANVHVMRSSLLKLRDVCSPRITDDAHWRSNVEKSEWLQHIKSLLAGALRVVHKVESQSSSVLVHCTDGWDRTAQLTSLAMLMLDPYYRTVRGFQVLVEKEWCEAGHQFCTRVGHGQEKLDQDRSPVFFQWLDCVWQLLQQFPRSFEFNERLLIDTADHLYSCLFGTFLQNCNKDAIELDLELRTHSLWSYINSHVDTYTNPFFKARQNVDDVLYPVTSLRFIRLWTAYYCRSDPTMLPTETLEARHVQLHAVKRQLAKKIEQLRLELQQNKAGSDIGAATLDTDPTAGSS